jgi:hypothetical protein
VIGRAAFLILVALPTAAAELARKPNILHRGE